MRLRWVVLWAVALLGFAIFSTTYYRELARHRELQAWLEKRRTDLTQIGESVERSRERAEFLKSPEGRAWIAREKMNMALPGEKIYRLDLPSSKDLSESDR